MEKQIGNNLMRYIFLFIAGFMIFSCKKEHEKIRLSDMTNESNYKITNTKKNDTITQIHGESKLYSLVGYKDIKNNAKVGWWKIKDLKKNHIYEIEYLSLDKNKENQVKLYENGKIVNRFSKYYNVMYNNNGYDFKFYFPQHIDEDVKVEFEYITIDGKTSLNKTVTCKKENDYYTCYIPVKSKDQLLVGIVSEFTSNKKEGKAVVLSSSSMYVNTSQ